jgi:pimeloyl-ACP methyl ester carboxylesterase
MWTKGTATRSSSCTEIRPRPICGATIIRYAEECGRCLAPDLVGMGQSGKSPTQAYRLLDHARYLDAWFDALHLNRNIVLVLHDWGSALGFYRAFRYRNQVQAIVVQPRRWEDFPNGRDAMFRALRSGALAGLFDHHCQTECLRTPEVDRHLEFGGQLDWRIRRRICPSTIQTKTRGLR